MEDVMKRYSALIVGCVFMSIVSASAQELAVRADGTGSRVRETVARVPDLRKAEVNYLVALNSDFPGVVESALGHVTLMRIAYPHRDLGKIQTKLYDLASRGATKPIRQKAFMAMQVFADPTSYKGAIADRQANGDGLLEALGSQWQMQAMKVQ